MEWLLLTCHLPLPSHPPSTCPLAPTADLRGKWMVEGAQSGAGLWSRALTVSLQASSFSTTSASGVLLLPGSREVRAGAILTACLGRGCTAVAGARTAAGWPSPWGTSTLKRGHFVCARDFPRSRQFSNEPELSRLIDGLTASRGRLKAPVWMPCLRRRILMRGPLTRVDGGPQKTTEEREVLKHV